MILRRALLATVFSAAALPAFAADTYAIDTDHTHPAFEFPHMGISWWRGIFGKTSGTVTLDRKAKTGTVDITVDTGSIEFAHDKMNEHAVGEKWFNVAKFPNATYKGAIKFKGDTPDTIDGQLTLLGVTKPLTLKINEFKCIDHPYYKREACGADATGELNRADFGLTKGAEGEMGKVKLRIAVEALKQ
jgi:polyisoprenoid-binding protein YceI